MQVTAAGIPAAAANETNAGVNAANAPSADAAAANTPSADAAAANATAGEAAAAHETLANAAAAHETLANAAAAHETLANDILLSENAALAADLYALIAHVHKNCNAELLEAVGGLELSLTQIKLLHHLDDATTALTLKQGAEAVRVSLPAASRLVDDLVNRGLIERREDVEDRRMKRIQLAERGRLVITRLNAARLTGLEQFVTTLNRQERQQLATLLSTLLRRDEIAASRPPVEGAP